MDKNERLDKRLVFAATQNDSWTVIGCLFAGADVNAEKLDGRTALSYAAKGGCLHSAKVLLAAGADPNRPNRDDEMTPLMEAVHWSHAEIVDLLLSYGADVSATRKDKKTALDIAKTEAKSNIISALEKAEAQ